MPPRTLFARRKPASAAIRLRIPAPAGPRSAHSSSVQPEIAILTALYEQDSTAFGEAAAAYHRLTGGHVFLLSRHLGPEWSDRRFSTGALLRAQLAPIERLFEDAAPYNRLFAKHLVHSLLFEAYRSPMAAFCIERAHACSSGGDDDTVRITALGLDTPPSLLRLYADVPSEQSRVVQRSGAGLVFDIPIHRDIRGRELPPANADLIEPLSNGHTRALVERVAAQGATAIRKTAVFAFGGRELLEQARHVDRLRAQGVGCLPAVRSVTQRRDVATVVMEDVDKPAVARLFDRNGAWGRLIPSQELWSLLLRVYESLVAPLYSRKVADTPPRFAREHLLSRARARLTSIKEGLPALTAIVDARYIRLHSLDGTKEVLPGIGTLFPFLEAIADTGLLDPPYLCSQHGDLNLGNILFEPLDLLIAGHLSSFSLVDPAAIDHDYMHDFAKMVGGFVNLASLSRQEDLYGYVASPHPHGQIPALQEWIRDESDLALLGQMAEMTGLFEHWLGDTHDFFGLEQGAAWKARLLFHTGILAVPAKTKTWRVGEDKAARMFYVVALRRFRRLIDETIAGAFGEKSQRLDRRVRRAWHDLRGGLVDLEETSTATDRQPIPGDAASHASCDSIVEQLAKAWDLKLAASRPAWKHDPRFPIPYNAAAAAISYDPSEIPQRPLGRFTQAMMQSIPESNWLTIERDEILNGIRGGTLMAEQCSNGLMLDPDDDAFLVVANRWPKTRYHSMLISRSWQPQWLTSGALRAQLRWSRRGMVTEFHRKWMFVDHLHVHLFPRSEVPIHGLAASFRGTAERRGVAIGTLADLPLPHIALAAEDPDDLEMPVLGLTDQLEGDHELYHLMVLSDEGTRRTMVVFTVQTDVTLPFGFNAVGLVRSENASLTEEEFLLVWRRGFRDEAQLQRMRGRFWTAWTGAGAT
jgi:hypothetical protein